MTGPPPPPPDPAAPQADPPPPGDTPPTDAPARPRPVGRLSAQGWTQLVLAVNTTLLIVLAVVGAVLQAHTDSQTDTLSNRILPARSVFFQMETALVDQETGVRGYVLSRDPDYLEPYSAGQVEQNRLDGRLRRLIGDRDRLVDDLDRIVASAENWRTQQAEPLIAAAPGQRVSPTELDASKDHFDRTRKLFDATERDLDAVRDTTRASVGDTRELRTIAFGGMLLAALVGSIALALLLHRIVGRPLRMLETASSAVSGGDFARTIHAEGPRDLQQMAYAVEEMRRRVVAELVESKAREDLLAHQTTELKRSNAELEQFAYVASHDLQEPLRKVASFCQLLEKRYGGRLDERATQYIAFAVDGARRMQVLINDLLTFSRVGRVGDEQARVALDDVLDRALANLEASIEDADAEVVRPPELPRVTGDPTTLAMLWQNLVGNAVKFRRPDTPCRITIDCERDGDQWRLGVTDTGIGIAPEFAEKVFVIFQRLHGRDEFDGTGIGLALCRKIVEQHGGLIRLDDTVTEGTRIVFTLPAADTAEDRTPPGAPPTEETPAPQGATP
ncbi:ATP-binding protein [Streptomyces sp. NPDC050560]|uniref:sensor histidine kinase n=1 Tax=Streptomyces sp. NPDC050560 TaxID=3365630 RepID=UPI0037B3ACCA